MVPSGLRVFLDVIASLHVPVELRIFASLILSDGIACRGGSSYRCKLRLQDQTELLRNFEEVTPPADFTTLLGIEVWRPVLNIIDPEGPGPPAPLDTELV